MRGTDGVVIQDRLKGLSQQAEDVGREENLWRARGMWMKYGKSARGQEG